MPRPGAGISRTGFVHVDGLRSRRLDAANIICQEPSENFASALSSDYPLVRAPIHELPVHPDNSLDVVGSLAGVLVFTRPRRRRKLNWLS